MVGIGLEELFDARSVHLDIYAIIKFMLPSRIAQCIKEEITDIISANPALKPSEIAWGRGLGFIQSTVDIDLFPGLREGGKRAQLAHALIHNGIPPAPQTIVMISKRILNISEYNYYAIPKQNSDLRL